MKQNYKVEIAFDDGEEVQKVTVERQSDDDITWRDILQSTIDACRGAGFVIPSSLDDEVSSYKFLGE